MTKSSGRSKTYACSQDGCPWEIHLKKRERVGESPEYYISTLNDRHFNMRMAIAKPTAQQIELMSTFDAAIRGDKNIKRKSIVSIVRARDGLNLQNYSHKSYSQGSCY